VCIVWYSLTGSNRRKSLGVNEALFR